MKLLNLSNVLLLLTLFSVGCEMTGNDTDEERDKISREVKTSLEGEILFSKDNSIYKTTAKSGGLGILISTLAYNGVRQKWSPDGSMFAYIRITAIENDRYLVICNKDGVRLHEWLFGTYNTLISLRDITWSPDGKTIAVLASNKIIYIDVAMGKLTTTQLYPNPGFTFWSAAWWPKGNKIAISEGREGLLFSEDGNQYIWMLEAYGNDPHKDPTNLLVKNSDPSMLSINYLDWSKDGKMLTYSGYSKGSIYIVNSDGTGNQKIISKHPFENKTVYGFAPCWMSNNKQIIFVGVTGVSGSTLVLGLFVTDINGTYNIDINIPGLYPDCY